MYLALIAGDDRADVRDVLGVLGNLEPAWLQEGEEPHLADELGVIIEQLLEGKKAADDVLRWVGAVDPHDQLRVVGDQPLFEVVEAVSHRLTRGRFDERGDVDGDRIGPSCHGAWSDLDRHSVEIDRQTEQLLRAEEEVAREAFGVERHDVVAEQAVQQPLADVGRQHPPGVGSRPRNVHEMREDDVGAALPDHVGDQVEVVVVQHHERASPALLDLVGNGIGERLIDADVAVLERVTLTLPDVGRVAEFVQAVLDEPQQGIGDHAVEVLVRDRVGLDESDLQAALGVG